MDEAANRTPKPRGVLALAGACLMLAAGLVHLGLAPEHLGEAAYLSLLFVADCAGAAVASFGIFRGRRWGWALGALVAGGAYASYFVGATGGLPGAEQEGLLAPVGMLAKALEALFLVLCTFAFTQAHAASGRRSRTVGVAALLMAVVPGLALAFAPHESHGTDHHGRRAAGEPVVARATDCPQLPIDASGVFTACL